MKQKSECKGRRSYWAGCAQIEAAPVHRTGGGTHLVLQWNGHALLMQSGAHMLHLRAEEGGKKSQSSETTYKVSQRYGCRLLPACTCHDIKWGIPLSLSTGCHTHTTWLKICDGLQWKSRTQRMQTAWLTHASAIKHWGCCLLHIIILSTLRDTLMYHPELKLNATRCTECYRLDFHPHRNYIQSQFASLPSPKPQTNAQAGSGQPRLSQVRSEERQVLTLAVSIQSSEEV